MPRFYDGFYCVFLLVEQKAGNSILAKLPEKGGSSANR